LEEAGLMLASQTRKTTVEVVHHRYGEQVAAATDHGLLSATDVGKIAYHVSSMGLKSLAKGAAMAGAKEIATG
jgi:hypothetical protein